MFVPMLIHGSPIAINFPHGSHDNERFWYWRGRSGQKYIHSVYAGDACPPLPGAIYVAVRRIVAGEQMNVNLIGIHPGQFRRGAVPEGRKAAHGDNGAQVADAPDSHINGAGKWRTGTRCINGVDVFLARTPTPIPKTLVVMGAMGEVYCDG